RPRVTSVGSTRRPPELTADRTWSELWLDGISRTAPRQGNSRTQRALALFENQWSKGPAGIANNGPAQISRCFSGVRKGDGRDRRSQPEECRQPPLASDDSLCRCTSERRRIVAQVRREVPKESRLLRTAKLVGPMRRLVDNSG